MSTHFLKKKKKKKERNKEEEVKLHSILYKYPDTSFLDASMREQMPFDY